MGKSIVRSLSIQEIIAQLKGNKMCQTITYTQSRCRELVNIAARGFPAGGFEINWKWSHTTKICKLNIPRMGKFYPECGKGCEFDQLKFLKAEEVAIKAVLAGGAVFKVPDCFSCKYKSECWGRECTCVVKHTCHNQINFRSSQKSGEGENDSDIEEETIDIPKVEPVVTEGEKVLKNKKEKAKEAKNRLAAI